MNDLTLCTVSINSAEYLNFQERVARSLASSDYDRLIGVTSDSTDGALLEGLPNTRCVNVDMQGRIVGDAHAYGLSLILPQIKTRYGLIIDPDALPLARGWDDLLRQALSDTQVAIGTPYSADTAGKRYQGLPNVIFFFFLVEPFRQMQFDWRPMPYRWRKWLLRLQGRLPWLKFNDFEIGWRLPGALRRHGYTAAAFDYVAPGSQQSKVLAPDSASQEYHWQGVPIATHLKGSVKNPYGQTERSRTWLQAVRTYVAAQGVALDGE